MIYHGDDWRAAPTDEDIDIRLGLALARNAHAWIATLRADDNDAKIMVRIMRSRRNNRAARAYATKEGS